MPFGHSPRANDEVAAVGKGRFFPSGPGATSARLGQQGPLTAIRGFFQSVQLAAGRTLLNVNLTHGVFKTDVLVSDLCRWSGVDKFGTDNINAQDIVHMRLRGLSKFLAKTRVTIRFRTADDKDVTAKKAIHGLACSRDVNRTVVFSHSFVYGGPQEVRFQLNSVEGQTKVLGNKPPGLYSVAEYWQWMYGQAPDKTLPLVIFGTPSKPMFFPAERRTITAGQAVRSKLSGDGTTAMLDFACCSPFANAVSIERESAAALGLDEPILKDFGITVDKRLLIVVARELPAPVVTGSWNLGGVQFAKQGPRITNWNWVRITEGPNPKESTKEVGKSVQKFVEFLNESGVAVDTQVPNTAHQITVHRPTANEDIRRAFAAIADYTTKAKGTTKGFFLFVILPRQETTLYGAVKSLAYVHFGFHTICSVERKFLQNNTQIFANIGLKWNLKNGGNNHAVEDTNDIVTSGKAMIVGYDVTHPTNMPNDRSTAPSLVGMVASVDRDLGQWPAVAWEQPFRQEMLENELTEHFKSRLVLWRQRNENTLPEFIIIYRDGVSESQFTQVLEIELPMVRKACDQLYPPRQRPKLTVIVSVKRHQTRFYPASEQNMDPKSRNINAPAADQLEKLTYNTCYLFGPATKAISICLPA
ncbi:ribonuclease H-like domain-containing protein [Colletotrichum godetiae]|uniref:Ribonuclease H-like domain-containing protein n=1 Tax=Colletotrichum godetiae TaxID=1209918 RepID=A0AAJ0A7S4_9PEZI|nr:ribonuclease H-like domain-containing protein [Colletotrichum godetiae]KAK1658101.1 ribonuclease H-like domain-containing protein [Colletotrichum godetiae]